MTRYRKIKDLDIREIINLFDIDENNVDLYADENNPVYSHLDEKDKKHMLKIMNLIKHRKDENLSIGLALFYFFVPFGNGLLVPDRRKERTHEIVHEGYFKMKRQMRIVSVFGILFIFIYVYILFEIL